MGVSAEEFQKRDIYIFYDYEDVYFRYDLKTKKYYKKFVGKAERECDPLSTLLSDAIRFGEEVTKEQYEDG